ncbi:MAG: AmmeMemoRadiSam system protein B [Patescibacteria group bacterium]|jgi:AmmeMemoRadiSam system protein B
MPLVFAAITPHPPVLIPALSKDKLSQNISGTVKSCPKTKKAFLLLEQELYASKPDTLIIISPHGPMMKDAFVINHSPVLKTDFSEFGDLDTKAEYKNDLALGYQLKESLESSMPLVLNSEEKIDYGSGIPLWYLTSHLKNLLVIPMSFSLLSRDNHLSLGRAIRKIAETSSKRIAIIASADLSHRLKKSSPDGYSPEGKIFDQKVVNCLKEKNIESFKELSSELLESSGQCGYQSILVLLGALEEINFKTNILSYDDSVGVGYLVANLEI